MSTTQLSSRSALNIVMGAMTFGKEGAEGARVHSIDTVNEILDIFQKHGHDEAPLFIFDGTCEEYLGQIDTKGRGLKIETKLYPAKDGVAQSGPITHSPEASNCARTSFSTNNSQLEMWYLHGPDRTTPFEDTLRGVNDLYKEGKFKRFGISNYMSWEVAEIVGICKANGYIQPTAYQGRYNAIYRTPEPELFPCLRKFGISFYEYNPPRAQKFKGRAVGGGFFTGRYKSINDAPEAGSRFDPSKGQGQSYRDRYWNEAYFKAMETIQAAADRHSLTAAEIALRWISHHSLMSREHGDSVLIGASSTKHIEQNLLDLEKGPLPEDVVKALDEAWDSVKSHAVVYWH
ncbi:hypothetical protein HWV62_19261 [Athelia sp. TMB]|nr:hypothetical protein HWV62_19261 [Athelia sp. TMB]